MNIQEKYDVVYSYFKHLNVVSNSTDPIKLEESSNLIEKISLDVIERYLGDIRKELKLKLNVDKNSIGSISSDLPAYTIKLKDESGEYAWLQFEAMGDIADYMSNAQRDQINYNKLLSIGYNGRLVKVDDFVRVNLNKSNGYSFHIEDIVLTNYDNIISNKSIFTEEFKRSYSHINGDNIICVKSNTNNYYPLDSIFLWNE